MSWSAPKIKSMGSNKNTFSLDTLSLGKSSEYRANYSPELLQAVPRSLARNQLGIHGELAFSGQDVWHGYELSWLNPKGKPEVALLRCVIPCTSPNLVESKSFKLYLNSFNQTHFDGKNEVQERLVNDLSGTAGESVFVDLFAPSDPLPFGSVSLPGECIDELDIEVSQYTIEPSLLVSDANNIVSETLHSHLLKSNCLITNQPD